MAKVHRFNFKNLDAYQAAVEHFGWIVEIIGASPRLPFVLRDQIVGAATSILANIGEANGRDRKPGECEQHYRYAQGSTYESAAYLDILSALKAIDDSEYNRREENLGRIAAMLARLMQKEARKR